MFNGKPPLMPEIWQPFKCKEEACWINPSDGVMEKYFFESKSKSFCHDIGIKIFINMERLLGVDLLSTALICSSERITCIVLCPLSPSWERKWDSKEHKGGWVRLSFSIMQALGQNLWHLKAGPVLHGHKRKYLMVHITALRVFSLGTRGIYCFSVRPDLCYLLLFTDILL